MYSYAFLEYIFPLSVIELYFSFVFLETMMFYKDSV